MHSCGRMKSLRSMELMPYSEVKKNSASFPISIILKKKNRRSFLYLLPKNSILSIPLLPWRPTEEPERFLKCRTDATINVHSAPFPWRAEKAGVPNPRKCCANLRCFWTRDIRRSYLPALMLAITAIHPVPVYTDY